MRFGMLGGEGEAVEGFKFFASPWGFAEEFKAAGEGGVEHEAADGDAVGEAGPAVVGNEFLEDGG